MKALTFMAVGGPEVLEYTDVADPVLEAGEVLVETQAIGLNFADIYRRRGKFQIVGEPPFINGYEGAGRVIASKATGVSVGARVAFADVPRANAELVPVPKSHAIPLPDEISFELAASLLLQGLTAQYLALDTHKVQKGELILVHAVAGGVGQLLTQIVKLQGGKVIGLTSSNEKRDAALAAGADLVFLYDNWKSRVLQYGDNKGVDVVYDSIGSTLSDSLEVTRSGGHVVFYGMAGGDPALIDPRLLMEGSKTLSGGDLWHYLRSSEERIRRASQLFDWVTHGQVKVQTPTLFRLADGASAHQCLESRQSTGKILLIP